jgi:hypothetical protein
VIFLRNLLNVCVDDSWVPSGPRPDLVNDEPPLGLLQFTVLKVYNELMKLDSSKGMGPDGSPPLILKNCASRCTLPFCMLFNRSLATCIFPIDGNSRLLLLF